MMDREDEIKIQKDRLNRQLEELKQKKVNTLLEHEKEIKSLDDSKYSIESQIRDLEKESTYLLMDHIIKNKDAILPLFKHVSYGKCSDNNLINDFGSGRQSNYCPRCTLLSAIEEYESYKYVDFDKIKFNLEVSELWGEVV